MQAATRTEQSCVVIRMLSNRQEHHQSGCSKGKKLGWFRVEDGNIRRTTTRILPKPRNHQLVSLSATSLVTLLVSEGHRHDPRRLLCPSGCLYCHVAMALQSTDTGENSQTLLKTTLLCVDISRFFSFHLLQFAPSLAPPSSGAQGPQNAFIYWYCCGAFDGGAVCVCQQSRMFLSLEGTNGRGHSPRVCPRVCV